jgi:tetratricopeptide (TPR) repeat protein
MQLIGEFIRQARRQHNLTQTELGGDRFSKSYVSAVERDKIEPSQNALTFFAEQLGLSPDYFTNLLQQPERQMQVFIPSGKPGELIRSSLVDNEHIVSNEELALLDSLLESTELYNFSAHYDLPTLSPEVIETFPPTKQARYYFLMGLIAQEKRDLSTALQNLEAALVFAPPLLQIAILDELGINYYLAQSYTAALRYHLRALNLLHKEPPGDASRALQFKVQFHCGNDYRALEAYEQACEHYELARTSLNPDHDIKTAASLYQGLGYCTHASIYQKTAPTNGTCSTPEEMERKFQHALDYYLQSRILYQVSGDKIGEATVRLAFARVKINFNTRRRQFAGEKPRPTINTASLLNDAEEQCRQVLMSWQYLLNDTYSSDEVDTIVYVALAYLVRIYTQHSLFAQREGYVDTALRERMLATDLCQQLLDTLSESTIPWTLVHTVVNSQLQGLTNQATFLPQFGTLPNFSSNWPSQSDDLPHSLVSYIEVYFSAAEIAEELGRTATTDDYATDCYVRADRCFQAALSLVNLLATKLDSETEPGYLRNCYQRCISILDERFSTSPTYDEETTRTLLDVLLNGLYHLQSSPPPSFKEAV